MRRSRRPIRGGSAALLAAITAIGAAGAAAAPRRLYLANDDHTDYVWTADADTYDAVFVDQLDYYLGLADATAAAPPPYQSRFNADGSLWLWSYERRRGPAAFDRLMARVKDRHIGVPMTTLVSCYGAQPAEAVLRGLYYAGRLERRYDLRFRLALAMENQTLPLGLASLWAGAGARYTWRGVCGCATRIDKGALAHRPQEVYWYEGLDGQRVLMKWYSLGPHRLGTYLEADAPVYGVPDLLAAPGLRRFAVLGAFGLGGDALARRTGVPADPGLPGEPGLKFVPGFPRTEHFHVVARLQSDADRQVIVSDETDFFEDLERTHGAELPEVAVTTGNEWDLYSASMAETSARVKRSVEKLRAAELLATLVALQRPGFLRGREAARDRAFTDLGLYWEHDWTADGRVSRAQRAAWQELIAGEIAYYVDTLAADGAARLGALMPRSAGAIARFFALNPLGWARTDVADFAYDGPAAVHVRDLASGRDVPHQIVQRDGRRFLRVLAADVPSTGYKLYDVLPGPGSAPTTPAARVVGTGRVSLRNALVSVQVGPDGALRSLVDLRRGGVELAATIDGLALNDLAADDGAGGAVTVVDSGPVSVTVRASGAAGLPHTTEVTLVRDSDRVDIRNQITANFADVRHWSFAFALPAPVVHTEEVGAIIRDRRKADGGDYADTHARTDYVTINHFADIGDGRGAHGVTLSNADLAFARLGHSTTERLDVTTPRIDVLAGGQVDGAALGIRAQNGATSFLQRFALRPRGAYDAAAAMRTAMEHQNPLVTGAATGPAGAPYAAPSYALVSVDNPNVLAWAVKPAEEGIERGVIVRVWNVAGTAQGYAVTLAAGVTGARHTTHVETDLGPAPVADGRVAAHAAAQQMQTLRLLR